MKSETTSEGTLSRILANKQECLLSLTRQRSQGFRHKKSKTRLLEEGVSIL